MSRPTATVESTKNLAEAIVRWAPELYGGSMYTHVTSPDIVLATSRKAA